MNVTTWNVLHRVHAVNWKEAPVLAFPDERVRIAGITKLVAGWLAAGETDVVCLQEVSGDQLTSLRDAVAPAGVHVFDHLYPRMPRLRDAAPGDAPVLDDPSEHLVTLVSPRVTSARRVDARTFDSDPGKGFLVVDADGVLVVDTHVSFGPRMAAQLGAITAAVAGAGRVMVLGDFNALSTIVRVGLGEGFVITDLTGQRHTRIPTAEKPGRTIDHVAVLGGTIETGAVLEHGGLSDHSPVRAAVRF